MTTRNTYQAQLSLGPRAPIALCEVSYDSP
jgi:hypothetical protein